MWPIRRLVVFSAVAPMEVRSELPTIFCNRTLGACGQSVIGKTFSSYPKKRGIGGGRARIAGLTAPGGSIHRGRRVYWPRSRGRNQQARRPCDRVGLSTDYVRSDIDL